MEKRDNSERDLKPSTHNIVVKLLQLDIIWLGKVYSERANRGAGRAGGKCLATVVRLDRVAFVWKHPLLSRCFQLPRGAPAFSPSGGRTKDGLASGLMHVSFSFQTEREKERK